MSNMVDYRCPDCDQPLRGKQAVVSLKGLPPAELSCSCGKQASLVKDEDNELGALCDSQEYSYE